MKGTKTVIVNNEQMLNSLNDWWERMTYITKDSVTSVDQENMNFVIVLEEKIEQIEKGE